MGETFIKSLRLERIISPRIQRLGWELFWIVLGQALTVVGALVGVRLLTEKLNPTLYGELALGLTMCGLVNQLAFGPLQQGILRFFGPAQEVNEFRAYLIDVWELLTKASFFILAIAGLLLIGLWFSGQGAWIVLAAMAFLLALISGYERALDAMQSAARHRMITAWHQAIGQWLRFLLAVGLIVWLGASSSMAMLGYILATSIVLFSQLIFFRRKFEAIILSQSHIQSDSDNKNKWTQRIRNYAWPFATWGLFLWLQQSSDRWALQTFSQTQDVGYYAVLFQLGWWPMVLFPGIIVQFLQPIFYRQAGDGTDPIRVMRVRKLSFMAILAFLALTGLGTGMAFILHAQIFAVFVAPEYRCVSMLMPWMVLSGGLFASSEVSALLLMSGTNTRILITPKISTAVLGTLLNIAGAYWIGLRGVVLASVSFSIISLIWMFILSNRTQHVGINQALRPLSS